jgi:hypothetical protein
MGYSAHFVLASARLGNLYPAFENFNVHVFAHHKTDPRPLLTFIQYLKWQELDDLAL